jgi:type III pantothenate kinase
MTMLLLDVGNSRLKWAIQQDIGLEAGGAIDHRGDPAAALSSVALPAGVRAAWAASVTGVAHEAALLEVARRKHGITLNFARVQADCSGLRVAYADPSRLGVDRWVQMLALWTELRGAFVVASAGTALTFDAVDAQGQHLGGVIAPGLMTSQEAVLGATRFAASGPAADYSAGLGYDTDSCVRQGGLHSCAGLLDRLGGRYAPTGTPRLLSGGDAPALLPHLADSWVLREGLVFEGLRVLAET